MNTNPQPPPLVPNDTSQRELAEAVAVLKQWRRQKSTMLLSEFNQYIPLFKYDGRQQLGDDRFNELATQWQQRIDIYEPVHVINDADNTLVFTLPPMFNRVSSVNRVNKGWDVATAFFNACGAQGSTDEFNHKKSYWGAQLVKVMQYANPEQSLNDARTRSNQMVDQLKKQGVVKTYDEPKPQAPEPPTADLGEFDVEPL